VTSCGICDHDGRHVHLCARCGARLTMKGADWRVRQAVHPNGTLGELVVEHFDCEKEDDE
jgi:hypothetical protein